MDFAVFALLCVVTAQFVVNVSLFRSIWVLTQVTQNHDCQIHQIENRPASLTTVVARPDAHHLN